MDQSGGCDEADRQALLAGRQPQSKSNMGLPRAAVADRDHVLSASDVLAAGKLQHHCFFKRKDRREVETSRLLTVGNRASLMRRSTIRCSRSINSSSAKRS